MLCDAGRILRKCRSEKRLRDKISHPHYEHSRSDSVFSSVSSSSDTPLNRPHRVHRDQHSDDLPRPSVDDWNPLRLHPPMDVDRSPFVPGPSQPAAAPLPLGTPLSDDEDDSGYGFGGDTGDIDDIIGHYGLTALRPPPLQHANRRPAFQRMKTATMDIHDGFDFGFAASPPTTPTTPTAASDPADAARPTGIGARRPSTASSTGSDCSSIFLPLQGIVGAGDAVPSMPLPSPAGQRRPGMGNPGSPDFLLKRGGWKRRGIVFVSEEAKVTEDDCFEIP